MTSEHKNRAQPWHVLFVAAAASLAGCGDGDRLETYPVTGTILINGEPAAGCTVAFVPLDPQRRGQFMPGGSADETGTFQLTTYETGDGAPAGKYGVTLRWEATDWPDKEVAGSLDRGDPIGPDRLMGKFSSPEKSELEVTIAEGENGLEPFRLENVQLLPGSK